MKNGPIIFIGIGALALAYFLLKNPPAPAQPAQHMGATFGGFGVSPQLNQTLQAQDGIAGHFVTRAS